MRNLTGWLLFAVTVTSAWFVFRVITDESPKIPDVNLDEWWGPGNRTEENTSLRTFKIKWSSEMILDLKHRLATRRPLPPPLEGTKFEYGFNSRALDPILDFWLKEYDFGERMKYMNKYPQYKTKIQGLDIHFIWIKPRWRPGLKVIPLLMLHGWPGSVREFYDVIPLMTSQRVGYDFVFELVVPSLVGFGYSEASVRPGLDSVAQAVIMRNLMHRIGHQRYYLQGGDWGSVITSHMATLFPKEVLGYHTNMPVARGRSFFIRYLLGSVIPWMLPPALAAKVYPVRRYLFEQLGVEFGYFHLQSTKPDTIGVPLTDSPAGLAAYILEKFSTGTNVLNRGKEDGGLSQYKTEDLLDNLMVYWDSRCITTSMRFYAENVRRNNNLNEIPTPVPTWAMHTAEELILYPAPFMTQKYKNLLDVSLIEKGGHFAAFEIPKEFTEDVFRAVRSFLDYHMNNKVEVESAGV